MSTFRLVRHAPTGGIQVIAEPIELPADDVPDINRALVRTLYRLWPMPGAKGAG